MDLVIRPMAAGDGEDLSALRRMAGVVENILSYPTERVEVCEQFAATADDRLHQFVAVARDETGRERVVGCAGFQIGATPRVRHSAAFAIMVHRDWQGKGVGTRLMEAVLDMADNWLMLVRLELTVFADNRRAIRLYEKYGFRREGVKRMSAVKSGRYADELLMARLRQDRHPL